MARYGVWVAVLGHIVLHDRRFQASVITGVIGAYALGSVTKNNQARPVRRAIAWYDVQSQAHDVKVLRRGRRALRSGSR
jgi:alpha-D-ribose 1-methylphosphonate 5-triphosphate diphosphatase PhnM